MTKAQLSVGLFCFLSLFLGVVCFWFGYYDLGIYSNTLVIAIQSILIGQNVMLRNHKEENK